MARHILDIGAPSETTHVNVNEYGIKWASLSGINIPEYLIVSGQAFLRYLNLYYDAAGSGSRRNKNYVSFRVSSVDSGDGTDSGPQMRDDWETRTPAFTLIVDGTRYDVPGPDSSVIPTSRDDQTEPYSYQYNSAMYSLGTVARTIFHANAATQAAIQLELNDTVLYDTTGSFVWVVPQGITSLKVELVGGGGGGEADSAAGFSRGAGSKGDNTSFDTLVSNGGLGGDHELGGLGGIATSQDGISGSDGGSGRNRTAGSGGPSGAATIEGLNTYGRGGSGRYVATSSGGGGGGGGAYEVYEGHPVTPGEQISFVVGGGGAGGRGQSNGSSGSKGAIRITYDLPSAPSFSETSGTAQSWVRNTVISPISIPRVAQGAPTPAYTSSGVPAGITVVLPTATADGSITGTPTSGDSGTITITATNASGSDTWTIAYNTVLDVSAPAFSDATGDAQTWSIGNTISDVVVPAASGTPTPAYAVRGSLPAGLSFNPSTRTISGTPTSVGSGTITVRATNSEGSADWTVAYTITKLLSFPDDPITIQDWSVGTAISDIVIPVAVGSITPTYAVQGSLPDGIAFNAGTRTLSGTPTTSVNVSTITIRATNPEARDDYGIRYRVKRASPTQTVTLPISEYELQFSIIKNWQQAPATPLDFDLAPPGVDLWLQGLRVVTNGQVDIRFASVAERQSTDHTGDDLSDQFERQGQFILQHGANVLTLNMVDTSDSDEPYTWQGDAAGTTFFRSIPSAGADITLTIRDKAPVVATLSASASTGVPLARAALVAAVLSASAITGVPAAQASLAPPTISIKASAGTPSASANLLPGQLPFDLSWASERGRTVYVSAVVTAGLPRGNGTVYEDQPGRTPLGSVSADSDMESQTGQSVTAIALNELFTGNITFWDAPSPLAWSSFFTDNPDVSLWMQFAPRGPIYPFVARGHGGTYSAWATGDTAAQAAVTAARAEGARFAFVLRGAPAVITLSASSTAGAPTALADLQQPTLSISASAAAPTARADLRGQLLSATASAGAPTATIDIEEQGVGINAYVPPYGYSPIVLAFLEADISGADITAEPAVTVGTGNDLIVASNLVISQVERHVAGSQIRLRRSGDGEFSTYFDNEGSPLYPDARLQILYDGSLIDGSISNTGGGFNNWSVANSAQRSKLNAIATGERFVLAILKKIAIEASASAIAPTAKVALARPLIAVDASAGVPTARVYFDSLPLSASSTAGTPTVGANLTAAIFSISASAGIPTAQAALISPTISLTATTNTPTAKASLASPTLSISASAGIPTLRARLASLVLTTADIDITNLDVYALALINTGTPTPNGTVYEDQPNRTPVGSIDAGGDLTARAGQDITRIALNIQGSGAVRFWDNPSQQSWTNFFGTYPRATLRLQFEIPGPAYELTRGGQGSNFSNWSTSNADARAAITSARANGKKFIFLLAEERITVRAGEGEKVSLVAAGTEGVGRKIDAATRSGSGEFGESATEGVEGTGNSQTTTSLGEGEVGRVTASAVEGQGASIVIKEVGSGEFGKIITSGMEGSGTKITPTPNTGSGEFGGVVIAGKEGTGVKITPLPIAGSGEFASIITSGKEGAGVKIILLPVIGLGEFGNTTTSGKEGVGRKNAAKTLSGTGEFGTVSSGGNDGAGRFGGSLAGFIKIGEVRGISFPRTGLEGNASYDITLRSRDRTGNTGDLVPAGTVLTEDLLDVFGAEFIFRRNNTGVVPSAPISTAAERKDDDYIPVGWTDNPQGVNETNRYEYISSRTGSPGRWSEFGVPGLYDIFIIPGDTEAQFIFRRTTSASAPNAPVTNATQKATDSYIPPNWSRNPQGTTNTLLYEWASYRLGRSQDWSTFYPPTLREASPTARGPISFFRAISASRWSDSEANLATTGYNVTGDRVTLYNSTATWTETRAWSGFRWITIGKWIDGNLIVEGTVLSIFDIIAGAAVQSSNYRAGTAGWRIAQDGGAEFDAASIRGVLSADHIDSDVQNVVVLKDARSTISLTGSTSSIALDQSVLGFTSIFLSFGYYTSPQWYYTGINFPVSRLVSGSSGSPPSGYTGFDVSNPSNVISIGRISFWRSSNGMTLYFRENPNANAFSGTGVVRNIIGVRNPGSTVVPTPDPTPATTTDTDTIYRLSTSTPRTPTGGTSTETHTPSGWSRNEPSPTVTQGVYSATRTRTYTGRTFTSATSWGSVTQIQPPSSAPLALPDPSNFNAPQGSTTSVTLPEATGGTGNYSYSISGLASATGGVFTSRSRSLAITPTTGSGTDTVTYTVSDGVDSVSQTFVITRVPTSTQGTTVSADAGANQTVDSDGSVTLDGSGSVTNGQGTTSYAWSKVSGTGGSLSSSSIARPTFDAPTVTADSTIVYRLTVTNNGVSDTDDVTITVEAPGTVTKPNNVNNLRETSRTTGTARNLVTVKWDASTSGATSYRITWNGAGSTYDGSATTSGTSYVVEDALRRVGKGGLATQSATTVTLYSRNSAGESSGTSITV